MSEQDDLIGDLIAEVVRSHGVAISRDDPIVAVVLLNQTVLRRYLEETVVPATGAIRDATTDAVRQIDQFAEAQATWLEQVSLKDRASFLEEQKALHATWKANMEALAHPAARHRGPSVPEQRRQLAVPLRGGELHPPLRCLPQPARPLPLLGHRRVLFELLEEAGDIPQSVRFRPAAALTPQALAAIAEQVRVRVLRWFCASAELAAPRRAPAPNARSPARYLWAMLLARLFESLPLVCPTCGADIRIIAFITEAATVEQILTHIGEPPRPPPISSARGPPAWDNDPGPTPDWGLLQQPEPDFELDQRITW